MDLRVWGDRKDETIGNGGSESSWVTGIGRWTYGVRQFERAADGILLSTSGMINNSIPRDATKLTADKNTDLERATTTLAAVKTHSELLWERS
jgi:hypothetical protein